MANYTITRHTESGHTYGCTNFSTIQEEGQIASDTAGAALDATVVWDLKANTGYSVSVGDFELVGATSVGPTPFNGTAWKDLPSPILGATMIQISSILIRITLYLMPPNLNTLVFNVGNNLVMPNSDIDINVAISGCAKIAGAGVMLRLNAPLDTNTVTVVEVSDSLRSNIASNYVSSELSEVSGVLPPLSLKVAGDGTSVLVMSYLVSTLEGYRYASPPTLVFNDDRYHAKTIITQTENPYSKDRPKDTTSVRFDIYKKN